MNILFTDDAIIHFTLSIGLVFNHQNKLHKNITAWVYLTLPALLASFLFAVNFYYIAGTSYSLNINLSAYWIMITFIVFNISLAFIQSKLSYHQKHKSIMKTG